MVRYAVITVLAAGLCLVVTPFGFSTPVAAEESRAKLAVPESAEVLDMVLVSIDGDPLTLEDVKSFIRAQGEVPPDVINSGKFDLRRAVHELMTQRLIEKEAKAAGVTASDEDVQAYIDEIKKQNHVDAEGFAALLKARGLTVDAYKKQVVGDIVRTRIVGSRIRSRVSVSDEDISRHLAEHPSLAPKQGELHVHQVFFPQRGQASPRAELRAGEEFDDGGKERLDERIEEVQDSDSLDEFKSNGGEEYTDLGYINASDLIPELAEPVEELEVGSVSTPIVTEKGTYLLFVSHKGGDEEVGEGTEGEEKQVAAAPPVDDEIRAQIRKEITDTRLKEELDKWVREELPKKYHVEEKF